MKAVRKKRHPSGEASLVMQHAADAERERCAKICDRIAEESDWEGADAARECAAAIRNSDDADE